MTTSAQTRCHAETHRPTVSGRSNFHTPVSVSDHPVRSAFALQIQEVLGTRLSISSQSSIKTVISKWWLPFLGVLGSALPFEGDFIPAGHQSRGHLMAAFALHMAHKGLKYGTIQGYIWCLCERHIQQHGIHCNPLDNVVDWSRYMSALDVQAFVDSTAEPTKMVPFQLFSRTLAVLNKQDRRSKRTREDPDQREWRPVGEATGILSMRYWTDQYLVHGKRPKLWSNPDDPLFVHADRSVLTSHSNLAECAMDTVKDFQFRRKLESFGYNFT